MTGPPTENMKAPPDVLSYHHLSCDSWRKDIEICVPNDDHACLYQLHWTFSFVCQTENVEMI